MVVGSSPTSGTFFVGFLQVVVAASTSTVRVIQLSGSILVGLPLLSTPHMDSSQALCLNFFLCDANHSQAGGLCPNSQTVTVFDKILISQCLLYRYDCLALLSLT